MTLALVATSTGAAEVCFQQILNKTTKVIVLPSDPLVFVQPRNDRDLGRESLWVRAAGERRREGSL